ncbi:COP9/signalosome complex subunit Csn5 [Schizosaccharomyces japonicus yFS275]|uniref:COP9 signalosome complex subunit 5 n=1 Tax=Schizosaccharomyces japonicus (strain yFS275 / FY16936) TaxID=402676 RepID=B6JWE4_SCHJY|nr:COP9/signalosome complex subunit Csn5 [Schizosaccharomyces japonicus yFS275]EEB05695.2 COP9/signalosome complex subunit Csn5 [Schizosaccharomyces japonicus yFS275]
MLRHVADGVPLEVMGYLQGFVRGTTMVVMDAFALPVKGTETRVNAHEEALEFSVQYQTLCKAVHRPEYVIGWYHSHPNYGCWLSGIDVETQRQNQRFQDPFVAIVVDPIRSRTGSSVDIAAFRTFPVEYVRKIPSHVSHMKSFPSATPQPSMPASKVEDYGVHANDYYELPIQIVQSSAEKRVTEYLASCNWAYGFSQPTLLQDAPHLLRRERALADRLKSAANGEISVQAALQRDSQLFEDNEAVIHGLKLRDRLASSDSVSSSGGHTERLS